MVQQKAFADLKWKNPHMESLTKQNEKWTEN